MIRPLFLAAISTLLIAQLAGAQPTQPSSDGVVVLRPIRITTPLLQRVIRVNCPIPADPQHQNIDVEIKTEFEKDRRGTWTASPRGSTAKMIAQVSDRLFQFSKAGCPSDRGFAPSL